MLIFSAVSDFGFLKPIVLGQIIKSVVMETSLKGLF